jgi:hypothetical protein
MTLLKLHSIHYLVGKQCHELSGQHNHEQCRCERTDVPPSVGFRNKHNSLHHHQQSRSLSRHILHPSQSYIFYYCTQTIPSFLIICTLFYSLLPSFHVTYFEVTSPSLILHELLHHFHMFPHCINQIFDDINLISSL